MKVKLLQNVFQLWIIVPATTSALFGAEPWTPINREGVPIKID